MCIRDRPEAKPDPPPAPDPRITQMRTDRRRQTADNADGRGSTRPADAESPVARRHVKCREESTAATPKRVPGTRSNVQAWTIDSSQRVPGTHTRDRRGRRSFDAPSPRRAPRGSPLRQCWDSTGGAAPLASLPTLSKTAPRRRRCRRSANRFGRLTPEVVFSQRSAASMSRRLRYEGREGLPGGACQRARWRSIAGRSRSRKRPRGRARASARARAAPQALPPNASHHRSSRPREADRANVIPLGAHRERGEEGQTSWSSLRCRASRARREEGRLAR